MTNAKRLKPDSDIFVTRVRVGKGVEYHVYPSPFIVRQDASVIQFRNLSGQNLEIDLHALPVVPKTLRLPAGITDSVALDDPSSGLYEYEVLVPDRDVFATGGSSPKVIIDLTP